MTGNIEPILPATKLGDAIGLAEKLRRLIRKKDMPIDDHMTASFGVAAAMRGERLSDIMKRADGLLYQAKRAGRNRVVG